MKKFTLQIRITIVCALVLIGIATILTVIAVRNAQLTYLNQFEVNFGNDLSLQYNNDKFTYNGNGEELVNKILDFVDETIKNGSPSVVSKEQGFFTEAGKQFAEKSLWFMILFIVLGTAIAYYLAGRVLKPVRKLSQSVKEINESNLYLKLTEPVSKDEIGSLTGSFNGMLERLNESFTNQKNFAANAAHELRTPLSTMKAGIQVLEMDEEPTIEDYKETIDIMKKNTDRLIKIVDDLLILSKSEQGDLTNTIDLSKILHEIKQELSDKATAMNISINLNECEGTIEGNETLIYRALFNLIENAVKYNKIGGTVTVYSIRDNSNVKISVMDNGIGISKGAADHIFEPFYRADRYRTRKIGGSGLGLAIVKGIVEKHSGRINVTSIEGEGTTFEVLLPAKAV